MFELIAIVVLFFLSVFIGAGMYVGGLGAEWAINKIRSHLEKIK